MIACFYRQVPQLLVSQRDAAIERERLRAGKRLFRMGSRHFRLTAPTSQAGEGDTRVRHGLAGTELLECAKAQLKEFTRPTYIPLVQANYAQHELLHGGRFGIATTFVDSERFLVVTLCISESAFL